MKTLAFCITLFISTALAGPFGLEFGQSLDELTGEANDLGDGVYLVDPPKSHSLFGSYLVRVAPGYGIYWIKAVTPDIKTKNRGSDVRMQFQGIRDRLASKYGAYEEMNIRSNDQSWNGSTFWMSAIFANERQLYCKWSCDSDNTLPPEIEKIVLAVQARDPEIGYITVEYFSHDFNDAQQTQNKVEDDNF